MLALPSNFSTIALLMFVSGLAAAAIDHFGILGALKTIIIPRRVDGLCAMALGVSLARKPQ